MRKPRKPEPFRASKEVKRRARAVVGAPPPSKVKPSAKRKAAKHKKKEIEPDLI